MKWTPTNITSIFKNPLFVIALGTVVFIGYSKLKANSEENAIAAIKNKKTSSISYLNGRYRVDSSFIRNDLNKAKLISELEQQKIEERKTINEIPRFIWQFLDSMSYDKKFDIVNPGEDWKIGIMDYGHVVIKKVYDPVKKDSVPIVSGDGAVLPNKQLVYFGMNDSIALMSYLCGGLGFNPNILIFKHNKVRITDFWYGTRFIDEKVSTKSEILSALKSKRKNGC